MFEEEVNELKIHLDEAQKRRDSGEYKEAIEALYKALDIDKKNLDAHVQLAEIFLLMNDFERSLKYYKFAHEIDPSKHDIVASLCNTAYKAGLYRDALDYAKLALETDKSDKNYSMCYDISAIQRQQVPVKAAFASLSCRGAIHLYTVSVSFFVPGLWREERFFYTRGR